MRIARLIPPIAVAYGVALGATGLSGGCSSGVSEGDQVPVNNKQQQEIRAGMQKFLAEKAATEKQANKASRRGGP
jgi:hypothetical protein